jgi:hypothetical protein
MGTPGLVRAFFRLSILVVNVSPFKSKPEFRSAGCGALGR